MQRPVNSLQFQSRQHWSREVAVVVAVGIAAFVCWALVFIWRYSALTGEGRTFCLFDDALISMRYAHNLAAGDGLVWNPGEYVEGYTNPLQVLLMAGCTLLASWVSPTLLVQLLGLGCLLVGGYALARVAQHLVPGQPFAPCCGWAAMAAYYPLHYWALTGMETGAVFALVCLLCWVALLMREGQVQLWPLAGLMAFGLYLARPDAVLLAALPLLLVGLAHKKALLGACLMLFVGVAAHLVWRQAYYGEWLPNTYTLKVEGHPLAYRLANGLGFVGIWAETMPLLALGALVGLWYWRSSSAWILSGMLPLSAAYQVYAGGDPWPYWRIMAPAVPLCGTFFLLGLAHVSPMVRRKYGPAVSWTVGAMVVLLTWSQLNSGFRKEILGLERPYTADRNEENLRIARHLTAHLPPDASVGLFYAGMAYWTPLRAVDFLGKCDKRIAHQAPHLPPFQPYRFRSHAFVNGMHYIPGHNKYDLNYTVSHYRPEYVERVQWFEDKVTPDLLNLYQPMGPDSRLGFVSRAVVARNPQILQAPKAVNR